MRRVKYGGMIAVLAACLYGVLPVQCALANNIAVSNIVLTGLNTAGSNIMIRCDVKWDNSWRDGLNWDAAWVFAKWRPAGTTNWSHCSLVTNGHVAPAGCTITSWDASGAMIYRTDQGTGNISFPQVKLRWNYGAAGLVPTNDVELKVFAIEMVYVPQGAFAAGKNANMGWLYTYSDVSTSFTIANEGAINIGTTAGYMWSVNNYLTACVLPAAYPKGYNAFYCMKYEVSQKQYADFLNMLTLGQAINRDYNGGNPNRYSITGTWPNYIAGVPDRACNFLGWEDDSAYLDWAGLRFMTELEFEKACRGPASAVADEYVWGNTSRSASPYAVLNNGLPNEVVVNPSSDPSGNVHYNQTDSVGGPMRCGIFAASKTNPTRAEAGATYWGIMDMGGSLWEPCIQLNDGTSRNYTGTHGDGALTAGGDDDVANWPTAGCQRGGSWAQGEDRMRLANRQNYNATPGQGSDSGCRGVRSAP